MTNVPGVFVAGDMLEIAQLNGNAQQRCAAKVGDKVVVSSSF